MMNPPASMRPMDEAPTCRSTWVALWYRDKFGNIYPIAAHYADGGGEEQPRFRGWFKWTGYDGGGFVEAPDKPLGWTDIGDER